MLPRLDRRLGWTVGRAVALWALMLVPWPGLGDGFTRGFNAVANAVVRDVRWQASEEFWFPPSLLASDPLNPRPTLAGEFLTAEDADARPNLLRLMGEVSIPNTLWYSIFRVRNTETGGAIRIALCVRETVYVPLAVFFALTFAAPIAKTRRFAASVGLGLALVGALIMLLAVVPVALSLVNYRLAPFDIGLGAEHLTNAVVTALTETTTAVVVLLWTFARWAMIPGRDWLWLRDEGTPATAAGSSQARAGRRTPPSTKRALSRKRNFASGIPGGHGAMRREHGSRRLGS